MQQILKQMSRIEFHFRTKKDLVDARDRFGKWCAAEVSRAATRIKPDGSCDPEQAFVHWLGSSTSEWDEWIGADENRFAPPGTFTNVEVADPGIFGIGRKITVLHPSTGRWDEGVVNRVDGAQIRVVLTDEDGNAFGYWFHSASDDVVCGDAPRKSILI